MTKISCSTKAGMFLEPERKGSVPCSAFRFRFRRNAGTKIFEIVRNDRNAGTEKFDIVRNDRNAGTEKNNTGRNRRNAGTTISYSYGTAGTRTRFRCFILLSLINYKFNNYFLWDCYIPFEPNIHEIRR